MAGDSVSHSLDEDHAHDLKIENVLDNGKIAKYGGDRPGVQDYRRCVVERPLVEPHDIFGSRRPVLLPAVRGRDPPRPAARPRLHRAGEAPHRRRRILRGLDLYPGVRKAIRSAFWQDEM